MYSRNLFLFMALAFSPEVANCQTNNIEKDISSTMMKYGCIGMAVAVVKNNTIIYNQSFGNKSREGSIPLGTGDLFRIASVSKTFVATAIMQLVEKRLLSLDDDVNKYLDFNIQNPQYPEIPITIKMLLCHRSSINDTQGWIKKSFDNINPTRNPQYNLCYNNYSPGEGYSYCNLNYELLGAVIEKVTKKRFDRYIDDNIVKPLGIKGGFNIEELDSSLFVKSYKFDIDSDSLCYVDYTYKLQNNKLQSYLLGYNTSFFSPASGMIISTGDLAHYMIMHMNYGKIPNSNIHIINEDSEQKMWEVQTKEKQYALSFKHYTWIIKGEDLIGQTGGLFGIHTAMIFHPKKKYGFVIFCNGCNSKAADGHELNFEVIKYLYNRYIE